MFNLATAIIITFSHPFSQPIITLTFAHALWQYNYYHTVSTV